MKEEKIYLFWVAGIILTGVFLYLISGILLPFVVGILVAYFLDPAADRLEKSGFSRTSATGVIVVAFFLVLGVASAIIFPLLYSQIMALAASIPEYYSTFHDKYLPMALEKLDSISPGLKAELQNGAGSVSAKFGEYGGKVLSTLLSSGAAALNLASLLFVTPVVAFYLLRDWDHIKEKVDNLLPRNSAPVIREQLHLMDLAIAGFVRGQTNVCIALGIFYAVSLTLAGLNYGFAIGFLTGVLTFIPYVGALFGFVVGVTTAFFQFSEFTHTLFIVGIFMIGQVLESNFLSPRLVGDKVGLHPAWIIFSMLAFASLFGFVGVLVAIPSAATIGVLVRFIIGEYKKSRLYLGPNPPPEDAATGL